MFLNYQGHAFEGDLFRPFYVNFYKPKMFKFERIVVQSHTFHLVCLACILKVAHGRDTTMIGWALIDNLLGIFIANNYRCECDVIQIIQGNVPLHV